MDYPIRHAFLLFLILCLFPVTILSQPIIIDHTCTDLSQVTQHWINHARNQCVPHYAFTSHGSQIMYGLDGWHQLNAHWHYAAGPGSLPPEAGNPNTLRIFGGNQATTSVEPGGYWQGPGGMNYTRNVLNANPGINVSMWSWCTQLNWYTAPEVDAYLASMTQLESEYPGVIFVYFTGNAQAWSGHHTYTSGADGWNRYQRNEQIRTYCRDNNKVLFDFADFDCWYQGEQATASWGSNTYPREHDHYNMNQAAHTSNENCTNKGGAWWWMLARISG